VSAPPARRKKRLGVIGSFVWDVIHGRDVRSAPIEEWGGITYALGALDAALPEDWEIVPVMKVGYDLAERAREALEIGEASVLPDLAHGRLDRITAAMVYEASERGDPLAREIVRDTARFLGAGIANLLNTFNPDVVVIAGGVTQAGEALFEPLRAEVRRRAFKPAVDACRIVPGTLPGSAGVVGAVATFLQQRQ
jgi:hypothetical protein